MRLHARLGRVSIACAIGLLASSTATAVDLSNWQASQGTATGRFLEVSYVGGQRIYAGYEVNPANFQQTAKLYSTSGNPGSMPVVATDLGLTSFDSVAVSVSFDLGNGYYASATETVANFENRGYIYDSDDLGNPTALVGPPPALDPDLELWGINRDGIAVGALSGTIPTIATVGGQTFVLPYPHEAVLFGIDSGTSRFGGMAAPSAGAQMVATIFFADGSVLMQDTVPGRVWDIEGQFAVGQRNGKAAYWVEDDGVWQAFHIEEGGQPADGELVTLDHRNFGLAGGGLVEGRPILADLRAGTWQLVEPELAVPAGTLWSVVGIDVDPIARRVALAVEATDFSGWDVTADLPFTALPGPGAWLAVAFLLAAVPLAMRWR